MPPDLSSVTLLTITGVDVEQSHLALLISSDKISFRSVKLLSPAPPENIDSGIEHVAIPPIDFRGYSRFVIKELHRYIDSDYCLIVQPDGFIVNPQLWSDEFLAYDYIGAPWPARVPLVNSASSWLNFGPNRVGNGGFSLRSNRLLKLASRIKFDELQFPSLSEDLVICHFLHDAFVQRGMRFAPLELARRFSCEVPWKQGQDLDNVFGFHGKPWLNPRSLSRLRGTTRHWPAIESLLLRPS